MHGLDTGQRQTDYKDPRPGLMFLCSINKNVANHAFVTLLMVDKAWELHKIGIFQE